MSEPQPKAAVRPAQQPPSSQPAPEAPKKDEKAEQKPEAGPITIAVWDLDDLTSREMSQPELGELLATKVVETIQKKGGYQVVEKQQLAAARQEMRVDRSSVTDPTVRLQLGKHLGAKQMVFGGYQVLEGKMRLELHLLDVESGQIVKSSEETAPATSIAGWLEAAQKAAAALL
jgi:TolB-like protein